MNRIKACIELPGVTENRLLNEDIRRSICCMCLGAQVGGYRHICFPTDLRKQVLKHNNRPEKLTLPEKMEVTLFGQELVTFS